MHSDHINVLLSDMLRPPGSTWMTPCSPGVLTSFHVVVWGSLGIKLPIFMSSVRKFGHETYLSFHQEGWAWNTSKFSRHPWGSLNLKHIQVFMSSMRKFGHETHEVSLRIPVAVCSWSFSENSCLHNGEFHENWDPHRRYENLDVLQTQTSSPMTWKLRCALSSNFLMKTWGSFTPKLPHPRYENLDVLQTQTSSWKLGEASRPNFITHDMKT
jgi:hypothetical protein